VCSATAICYKENQVVEVRHHITRHLETFSLCMHSNSYLDFRSFRSKIWPCHTLWRPQFPTIMVLFPLSDDVCVIYLTFYAQISFDLVKLTFDLLILAVSDELTSHIQRTYHFLASYDYPFLSNFEWLNLITLPSPGMCRVTWPITGEKWGGQKWSLFLKSLTPIYLFTL